MGTAERFEDLEVWKKARSLTRSVYAASGQGRFAEDRGLSRQIQRSAVSIMSNIAEGFDRFKRTEFHQFLCVAKGSCAGLRSQLYVAKDLGYIDETRFRDLMGQADELARLIGALRAAVAQPRSLQRLSAPCTQHPAPERGEP